MVEVVHQNPRYCGWKNSDNFFLLYSSWQMTYLLMTFPTILSLFWFIPIPLECQNGLIDPFPFFSFRPPAFYFYFFHFQLVFPIISPFISLIQCILDLFKLDLSFFVFCTPTVRLFLFFCAVRRCISFLDLVFFAKHP